MTTEDIQLGNEAQVIVSILGGEADLFHDLIRPYERTVYIMVLSLLRNEADAEDAAQETFLKAFRNLNKFRAESKFSTWLISIALNEARRRLRARKSHGTVTLDAGPGEKGHVSPALLQDWREVPSEILERQEVRRILQQAVMTLPEIYREIFLLRDVEELSVRENTVAPSSHDASGNTSAQAEKGESKTEVVPMVIDCKHVWEHISGYLDNTLASSELEEVQKHLEHCEICSAILDSTRNILILTADERVFELPLGFSERLHARLNEEMLRTE
jgi:RNA polymerase sigma-70 factor (ECF subfamily)